MRNYLLAAAAAVASLMVIAPAQANARPADCLVVAGGRTWINGPCNFVSYGGGAFTLYSWGGARVSVTPFGDGAADGRQFGTLYQRGACWVNGYAHVCAWQPGEPRWF